MSIEPLQIVFNISSNISLSAGNLAAKGRGASFAPLPMKRGTEWNGIRRQCVREAELEWYSTVQYYWGGKPINAGVPLTVSLNGAGTAVVGAPCAVDRKGRAAAGLDCSGFVGWVYWTVFGVKPGMSTRTFTDSLGLEQIGFGELQPGDVGLQAVPGAVSNHIGIFLGLDGNGKALWTHCSESSGVVVNNTNCFRLYYRLMWGICD